MVCIGGIYRIQGPWSPCLSVLASDDLRMPRAHLSPVGWNKASEAQYVTCHTLQQFAIFGGAEPWKPKGSATPWVESPTAYALGNLRCPKLVRVVSMHHGSVRKPT